MTCSAHLVSCRKIHVLITLYVSCQEYLFENGRIDNIFTDVYYDPFTTALHEVVKDFKLPVNELGYFVTRIEVGYTIVYQVVNAAFSSGTGM